MSGATRFDTQCEVVVFRNRRYGWVDYPGAGFSFDVDMNDEPIRTPANAHNHDALAGWIADGSLVDHGVEVTSTSHRVPALLRCECGGKVWLDGFTNPCACGRDYNRSGQVLAPRGQWGWDTGESLSDILRIP